MSDVINMIGGVLSGQGTLGKLFSTGTGVMDMIAKYKEQARIKAAQDRQMYFLKHPEALQALVKRYTQPLQQGLVAGVGNVVQGQMAERGLNQAPGIYQQVSEQALAPYYQNSQQMALHMALQQMGLPADILSTNPDSGPGGLAAIFKELFKPQATSSGLPSPTGGVSPTGPQPDWGLILGGGQPELPVYTGPGEGVIG